MNPIVKFVESFRAMVAARPSVGPRRWAAAMCVAIVSDIISFGTALVLPAQLGVDLGTGLVLASLMGWHWGLATALLVEAVPGMAVFPSWTLVVGALFLASRVRTPGDDKAAAALYANPNAKLEAAGGKVLSTPELAAAVALLKAQGKTVVFTNGVFDVLHTGHLRYLQRARSLGDALVVAINADSSVRGIKGDKRPILPQDERAELLAGLGCVTFVGIFDEPDPRAIIKAVRPNMLVKGGDWPVDKILGSDTVLADGGKVLSLPFVPGRSTTSIVESIVQRYAGGFKE